MEEAKIGNYGLVEWANDWMDENTNNLLIKKKRPK
jgi:hypothetical protein